MRKILMASALVLVLSVVFVPVSNARMAKKGWQKTVTLPSGEVILDVRGEWDSLREYQGAYSGLKSVRNIVKITQERNNFTAVRITEDEWHPKGSEAIKGELDKDGFKNVYINRADVGWVRCKWEISENGNKIVIDDGSVIRATLTRK